MKERACLVFIGTDTGDNNEVFLSPLEGIHTADLYCFIQSGLQGALALHYLDNVTSLALIGSDDTDLSRPNSSLQQTSDHLLCVGCLCSGSLTVRDST